MTLSIGPEAEDERTDVEKAFANFIIVAKEYGLPVPRFLSPARKAALKKRLALVGLEGWNEALGAIEKSAFLRGETGKWRASFDFMLQESSLLKMIEGNYDDSH